jgi:molecular chaperone DnaJ
MRDPYQVLGVSRDATEQQVTDAYRKLAKKFHPDLNPGDASAQKKMAEINVAYEEIKSGRAKYQDYSRPQGASPYSGQRGPYGGYGTGSPYGGFNPFDFFGGAFQQQQRQQQAQQNRGDRFDPVRHYVNAMRYSEALYALSEIKDRDAQWYYLSAVASYGLGNRVTALNHIDEAIRLDPLNIAYQQAREQIAGSQQSYTQRSRGFGVPSFNVNTLCMGLCCAQLFCRGGWWCL